MTEGPKIEKITTALARQMAQPGGRTLVDVERRAKERLVRHKGEVMAEIETAIAALEGLCAARPGGASAEVYRLASRVLDLAGFFDTGPLFDAGYSLADVADRMAVADAWDWPSVEVHVQALRLILNGGCERNPATDRMLAGLKAVAVKSRS
ncbi:chemotaxis protein CheE [Brevundimonas diminuta]|uniref:chemotaxis protein CheE n=1 Tax=Brevundimonas diminuta TaxID=293 RepID=UPI003D02420E